MTFDKILPVAKRHLLLANVIVWGAPGVKVLLTGIQSYLALWPSKSILVFLPVRGWILVIFMMCLGISLKHIPGIPTEFFASFYYGLGPALIDAFGKSYRKKPYL